MFGLPRIIVDSSAVTNAINVAHSFHGHHAPPSTPFKNRNTVQPGI